MELNIPENLVGLTEPEIVDSRSAHGYNVLDKKGGNAFTAWILNLLQEPMVLLLIVVSIIYVVVGQYGEAIFMFVAILAVSGISIYQDFQTQKALQELEKLNEPLSKVIRNRTVQNIPTNELVVGDLCIVQEGEMINADGEIVHSNDFSVNESSLTGESYSVIKNAEAANNALFSGTIAVSGLAIFRITQVGSKTAIGKIGVAVEQQSEDASPLRKQISSFVRVMAIVGVVIFLMVWAYRYFRSGDVLESLLNGLTMAMSVLPEEIPVAFTTFTALGAWKLMKKNIIVKRSSIIETLGSTSVICTDKTGTITENTMQLKNLYLFSTDKLYEESEFSDEALSELIAYAMWSSEPVPFDPMEKELHRLYEQTQKEDRRTAFRMFHEYPLEGKPPMMTHLFESKAGEQIIAAKGAPEAIIEVCQLSEEDKSHLKVILKTLSSEGFRILGVAKTTFQGTDFPKRQQEFAFDFIGFTVFQDPPKKGIREVFEKIYDAGIEVKVITGDNPDTTLAIATQAGIRMDGEVMRGYDLMHVSDPDLAQITKNTTLFTRMFPESKQRVVNMLKKEGEIVAMLGDGVNDAPALKAAHIGVAMGHKGTEIAKAAADLVITNDDLDRLVMGIGEGRRIYANLKKAIQYIISIHIPIILIVALPLFLGWIYPQIFTPIHVIFLELVMGPTCSIVYENEPMEKNTMLQRPRVITDTFLNWRELSISIVQGLVITLGLLFIYQYSVRGGADEGLTRAMVFSTLVLSNVFLSFTNRSFYFSVTDTLKTKNNLLLGVTALVILGLMIILYVPSVASFFYLTPLHLPQLGMSLLVASVSVLWFEGYKWIKRMRTSDIGQ